MGNTNFWILLFIFCYGSTGNTEEVQTWHIHDQCGATIKSYGGILHFNAARLRRNHCQFTVIGLGSEDVMISLYFASFDVSSDECSANVTIEEPGVRKEYTNPYNRQGLYQSICHKNDYLVQYSMFTTDHNTLIVSYAAKRDSLQNEMKFSIHFAAFTSRIRGCTDKEITEGMFSCYTGRCIHDSLLCKDLNPCGDNRDCNVTSASFSTNGEEKSFNYVKFIVIAVVVVFAVFALIQITLIARNKQTFCQAAKRKRGVNLDAELMPMNGHINTKETPEIEIVKT